MTIPKIPLTITYRHSGARPPVFVAGTFSDTPWQPQEMKYRRDDDGQYMFDMNVLAEAGSKVQYKFRLGTGDWWALDQNTPTVTDDAGNQNNIVEVPPVAEPSGPPSAAEKARRISLGGLPMNVEHTASEMTTSDAPGGQGQTGNVAKIGPDVARKILNRSDPPSGASTPRFARTAAEVADSAAMLDREDPEPEVPDEEAGRTGARRMSSTPIPQVADTAAEVADSASMLDCEEGMQGLEIRPTDYGVGPEPLEASEPALGHEDGPPLFAHECVGINDENRSGRSASLQPESHDHHGPDNVHGSDRHDYSDPTLEQFPSRWGDIVSTMRKLEGGLNEDHATIGGAPLSPAISPQTRRLSCDPAADLATSSVALSPVSPRRPRRLDVPRSPHGSVSSDRSSALSLQSIPEAEEAGAGKENGADMDSQERSAPGGPADDVGGLAAGDQPGGDTTETPVAEVLGTKGQGGPDLSSPGMLAPSVEQHPKDTTESTLEAPNQAHHPARGPEKPSRSSRPGTPKGTLPGSGADRDVLDTAEAESVTRQEPGGRPSASDDGQSRDGEDAGSIKATGADPGVDPGSPAQIKRRVAGPERASTPSSVGSAGLRPGKDSNWFRALFRMLFKDWIGGLVDRICGRRRQGHSHST